MNKARKENQEIIDIKNIPKGDPRLESFSKLNLFCFDEKCNAKLLLCSYKRQNIPAPYFKTVKNDPHSKDCSLSINRPSKWDGKTKKTISGRSAFNQILKKYEKKEKPNCNLTNNKTKKMTSNIYNKNTNNYSKTGRNNLAPIEADFNTTIEEKITYAIMHPQKLNSKKRENIIYYNLSKIGIGFKSDSIMYSKKTEGIEKIIIFVKNINIKNDRKYALDFDYIIIDKNDNAIEKS